MDCSPRDMCKLQNSAGSELEGMQPGRIRYETWPCKALQTALLIEQKHSPCAGSASQAAVADHIGQCRISVLDVSQNSLVRAVLLQNPKLRQSKTMGSSCLAIVSSVQVLTTALHLQGDAFAAQLCQTPLISRSGCISVLDLSENKMTCSSIVQLASALEAAGKVSSQPLIYSDRCPA